MQASNATITIRPAYADDKAAVQRLAALDSAVGSPPEPLLLAEIDGKLRVALSLRNGEAVADPFHATADTLHLMRDHAARTRTHTGRSRTSSHRRQRLHFAH